MPLGSAALRLASPLSIWKCALPSLRWLTVPIRIHIFHRDGYGRPANSTLIRSIFDVSEGNKFVFYSPGDMGIYGEDLEADFKRCMASLGVEERLDLNKKTENKR